MNLNENLNSNKRKSDIKVCCVCGDKALGYNFNAVTCESCKAFFRRNALRNKEFKCPFNGNCKIELITRRFCQKCRLNKCFEVGMKKEWILSENEKKLKKCKIEENRIKKQISNAEFSPEDNNSLESISMQNFAKIENESYFFDKMPKNEHEITKGLHENEQDTVTNNIKGNPIDNNYSLSNSFYNTINLDMLDIHPLNNMFPYDNQICYSSSSSSPMSDSIFQSSISSSNVLKLDSINKSFEEDLNNMNEMKFAFDSNNNECGKEIFCSYGSSDNVYKKTIELEFSTFPFKLENVNGRKELNYSEWQKLQELLRANNILKEPLPSNAISNPTQLLDVIKMTDFAIRRLISMSKKISSFKNLCQEDQIALLKGGCTEMMVLRSVMSFNEEKETLLFPDNKTMLTLEVLKRSNYLNIYERYKRFIVSFNEKWRKDENVFSILSAITLFSPRRPNLIHTDLVKLEQMTYIYLLQRYLETKCELMCEAKSEYLTLMKRLEELHALNEDYVRIYLNVNPNEIGPLLIEIFDLKP